MVTRQFSISSPSVMSLNATSASSAIFHKYSAQELYAGTDFSTLNWVERQWASWYLLIGDPVIATGLASFLLHEVCIRAMLITGPFSSIQTW
jgi:methylsterol monooxygenase